MGNVVLIAFVVISACSLADIVAHQTYVLADYHVYLKAARSLHEHGNPYAANADSFFEFQYRYPPLLALAMPVLRWVWFPLLAVGTLVPLLLRYRARGDGALMFPLHIGAIWLSGMVNGNAQGLVVGMTALAPFTAAVGGVFVGIATWVKLYPACVVVWWLGQRNWRALRWFAVTFVVLGIAQFQWLDEFVRYSAGQMSIRSQLSLRSLGVVPWLLAIGVLAYLTYRHARTDRGWLFCMILQIVVLPRLQLFNVPLLLMHPTVLSSPYERALSTVGRPRQLVLVLAALVLVAFTTFVVAFGPPSP